MNAAFSLLRTLDACEREGIPEPTGTAAIVVDAELCELLAKRLDVPFEVACTLGGAPVKEARAVVEWALAIPVEDRIRALRSWRRKRAGRPGLRRAS